MAKTVTGFVLIADISGYTMFLSGSELEHAQEILQSLLELLIENTRIPLIISRLEGDAVISYAPQESILQGGTLVEMVESCYVAFRRAIELMVLNTTCTCNACRNIPQLDLKFFVHHGTFGLQKLPAYTELVGKEVNLVHRLTKNHVREKLGFQAYTLYSAAAVAALGLQEQAGDWRSLVESYEHIGEVEVVVQDMAPVWAQQKEKSRLMVAPKQAMLIIEHHFPVGPVHLWDYLLKPELRALFIESDTAEAHNLRRGRIGEGTVYQCAHGSMVHPQTIVDWQPFTSHTILDELMGGVTSYITYRLHPQGDGTRLEILVGPVLERNPIRRIAAGAVLRFLWRFMGPRGVRRLRARIEQDMAEGISAPAPPPLIDVSAIRRSIDAALRQAPDGFLEDTEKSDRIAS